MGLPSGAADVDTSRLARMGDTALVDYATVSKAPLLEMRRMRLEHAEIWGIYVIAPT
jgi:hypothetical protein